VSVSDRRALSRSISKGAAGGNAVDEQQQVVDFAHAEQPREGTGGPGIAAGGDADAAEHGQRGAQVGRATTRISSPAIASMARGTSATGSPRRVVVTCTVSCTLRGSDGSGVAVWARAAVVTDGAPNAAATLVRFSILRTLRGWRERSTTGR
jgi:hypothetical protein